MNRHGLAVLLVCAAAPLSAQHPVVKASAGIAFADYREQSKVLDFRGSGPAGRVDVTWRRWGLVAGVERITFTPTDPDSPAEGFRAIETDVAVRYRPRRTLPVEVEVGAVRRTPTPKDGAQALRAFRIGAVAHFALGEGAEVDTRAAWLAGSKFSGGGSAGTAFTLQLRAAYRPLARFGWAWLVADYSFERFDRVTVVPVPLQGSSVRLALEGRFTP